jgi:hypothetical protein
MKKIIGKINLEIKRFLDFNFTEKYINRFWSHVDIKLESECWIWKLAKISGYGATSYHHKSFYAHRMAYGLCYGEFDQSLEVLHKCDNPSCCNPHHLFLGTPKDNYDDMVIKGRDIYFSGEDVYLSKLKELQVLEIRNRYFEGNITQLDLAKEYNVKESTINDIMSGRTWKHVGGPRINPGHVWTKGTSQLLKEDVLNIRYLFDNKLMSKNDIAKKYDVKEYTIRAILRKKTWKNL